MKKNTFLICIMLFSLYNFGQSNISINDLITNIKTQKKSNNPLKKPLLIQKEYFNQTINDYTILITDPINFRILGKDTNHILFQLVSINDHIHGVLLDMNNEFGYKISSTPLSNKVSFTKTHKDKLVFSCGTSTPKTTSKYSKKEFPRFSESKKNIGNSVSITNPLLLESRPGATHLIYLDFDGENSLPGWETHHYKALAVNVPDEEKRKIWEAVAEDFLPFDVNITNNRTLYDNHPALTKGWVVLADFNSPGWLGIAIINSYASGNPVLVDLPSHFNGNHQYLYRTPSHELGHSFSLKHDGYPAHPYYPGHGEYIPIMGTGDRLLSHWSKGEYSGATNQEDDISIISSYLGFANDDHSTDQLLNIIDSKVIGIENSGFIGTNEDTDTFTINLNEDGDIILKIASPLGSNTNLDIKATLQNSTGEVLQVSNPIGDRNAYININLPKGVYSLIIDGVGELTINDGFSDYGSLGYYEISGNIGFIAPESSFSYSKKNLCSGTSVTFNNMATGSDISYEWSFEGGNITSSNEKNPTITYYKSGLFNASLKTLNSKGEHTIYKQIHIGNSGTRIEFATAKLNKELTGSIQLTDEIISFSYNDLTNLDQSTAYLNLCLLEKCYTITLNNIYIVETCGENAWVDGSSYNGGDKVYFNGYIYEAKWWTDDIPTDGETWTPIHPCEITDESNMIRIVNNNSTYFETNPKEVGIDLFIESEFCGQNTLSINDVSSSLDTNLYSLYPNPSNNSLYIKGKDINKITIINLLGAIIGTYSVENNNTELKINTSNYKPGMYFALISKTSDSSQIVKKFYKK